MVKTSVIRCFSLFIEAAAGQFSMLEMMLYAFAADTLSWATRIGTAALFPVLFTFAFHLG
jgi:hypothetical protein